MTERTINAFCPNCGKRYLNMRPDFLDNDPGCGDCAQACVRPRELYRLREFTPWSEDTVLASKPITPTVRERELDAMLDNEARWMKQ